MVTVAHGVWPVAAQEDATSQEEPVKRKKLQAADGEPLGWMGLNLFEWDDVNGICNIISGSISYIGISGAFYLGWDTGMVPSLRGFLSIEQQTRRAKNQVFELTVC